MCIENNNNKSSKSPALKRGATVESTLQDFLKLNFASVFSFKNHSPFTIHHLPFVLILFLISSCSLFEEDKGNYLTGKINYLGNSGDKNVRVSLYNYPQINDTLLNLSIQYPNIGAKISRELLWV